MLIASIPSLSQTTTELIHNHVVPLSRQGVCDYLRQYETRQGWISPAMREAKTVSLYGNTSSRRKNTRVGCTKDVCQGPHPEKDCWSKPENAKKKEDFLSRQNYEKSQSPSGSAATVINGWKKVHPPAANAASLESEFKMISLHASYEYVTT